jgi:hypothetical protein
MASENNTKPKPSLDALVYIASILVITLALKRARESIFFLWNVEAAGVTSNKGHIFNCRSTFKDGKKEISVFSWNV